MPLEIRLSDLPELNEINITGVKKNKKETIIKENSYLKVQRLQKT